MNWQSLIASLQRHGWTLTRIAAETGAGVSTISEIAQGRTREPRGTLALRLHQLAVGADVVPPPALTTQPATPTPTHQEVA